VLLVQPTSNKFVVKNPAAKSLEKETVSMTQA
jgi:hypothetical protein